VAVTDVAVLQHLLDEQGMLLLNWLIWLCNLFRKDPKENNQLLSASILQPFKV
jgi:hypothetical protein